MSGYPPYLIDAMRYSSKRRAIFVGTFQKLALELNIPQVSEDTLVEIMELVHCSATIIDDMLDNENIRRGNPSYYVRHGYSVSAFAALNLMMRALELISRGGYELGWVLETVREMIDAEEADVGLRKREEAMSPIDWYQQLVSKKIAKELVLALKLCLRERSRVSPAIARLYESVELLGQFIQYCDDWRDVLVDDPFYQTNGSYTLTYSLPLAIYLTHEDHTLEDLVGQKLCPSVGREIINLLRKDGNVSKTAEFIVRARKHLARSVQLVTITGADNLNHLAHAAQSNMFPERTNYGSVRGSKSIGNTRRSEKVGIL